MRCPRLDAPPAAVAAARAQAAANAPAKASQLSEILGAPGAPVVAVEDGRIVHLGRSHALGRYLVLRDIYGDVFTYAGLGSIAPRYRPAVGGLTEVRASVPKVTAVPAHRTGRGVAPATRGPPPARRAGHQSPLTLKVKAHPPGTLAPVGAPVESGRRKAPAGMGRVRLFAHPTTRSRARRRTLHALHERGSGGWRRCEPARSSPRERCSATSTRPSGATAGPLRFAVRPAGDSGTIDPQPLLANWRQLDSALHPKGSKGTDTLLGATAEDALSMSKRRAEARGARRPGIQLDACGRRDVAAGAQWIGGVLAVLRVPLPQRPAADVSGAALPPRRGHPVGLSIVTGAGTSRHRAALGRSEGAAARWRSSGGHLRDQRHPDRRPPGPGYGHRCGDPHAARRSAARFAPQRIVSLMSYPEAPPPMRFPPRGTTSTSSSCPHAPWRPCGRARSEPRPRRWRRTVLWTKLSGAS